MGCYEEFKLNFFACYELMLKKRYILGYLRRIKRRCRHPPPQSARGSSPASAEETATEPALSRTNQNVWGRARGSVRDRVTASSRALAVELVKERATGKSQPESAKELVRGDARKPHGARAGAPVRVLVREPARCRRQESAMAFALESATSLWRTSGAPGSFASQGKEKTPVTRPAMHSSWPR